MSRHRIGPDRAGIGVIATLALGLVVLGGWRLVAAVRNPIGPDPAEGFEALRARSAYETSEACLPCHRDHVASWRRTFHRTMTQEASAASVVAPFDGRVVEALGVRSVARRDGEAFVIDTLDPRTGTVRPARIARVTGSRRLQQFETREDDRYVRLPIAWSIEEKRWLHLSEAFFHPDGESFHENRAVWDLNCIFCHTVKAIPALDERDRLASRPAELGIACEACHGPGEEHARRMRSPLRRYAIHALRTADPTIVHPGRIDKLRSVQICGHCHGQRLPADRDRIREVLEKGDPYTPGEDLSAYYTPVDRETTIGAFSFASRFWSDGSPRLTAYEYQGLLRSGCFRRGSMTCLSCHAMHAGDPHGQMRPDLPGDAICTQCHGAYAAAGLVPHTKHKAGGAGSRCVSCHMPQVVYGIMSWHPTHEIASPDPRAAAAGDRPDACTLCHSGKSSLWAAEKAEEWWPKLRTRAARPSLPAARLASPEIPRALFAGDVVYRTLAAARLAEPSPDPEPAGRAASLVAELLLDPYPNVRRTARLALERLTGRGDIPGAHEAPERRDTIRRDLQAAAPALPPLPGWPFGAHGELDRHKLEEWTHERKEAGVSIGE